MVNQTTTKRGIYGKSPALEIQGRTLPSQMNVNELTQCLLFLVFDGRIESGMWEYVFDSFAVNKGKA